jgi:hypothetical protein
MFFQKYININIQRINVRIVSFYILTISLCYSLFALYPNNWGDPLDYLFHANAKSINFSIVRFYGYPIFIKITSFNLQFLYLPILLQYFFYVFSVLYLEKKLKKYSKYSFLIILFASFPKFVYMNNLLFPDALVFSLVLIFFALLISNRIFVSFIILLLIFLLKSYLILMLVFFISLFLKRRIIFFKKIPIEYFSSILCAVFLFFFSSAHFVQALYSKIDSKNFKLKNVELCNMTVQEINSNDIKMKKDYYSIPFYTNNNITSCSQMEYNNQLSRHIVKEIFINQKVSLVINSLKYFYFSVIGFGTQDHLTSMIVVNFKEIKDRVLISKSLDYELINSQYHLGKDKDLFTNINILTDKFVAVQIFLSDKILFLLGNFLCIIILYLFFFKKISKISYNFMLLNFNVGLAHMIFSLHISDRHVAYIIIINILAILLHNKKLEKSYLY